MKNFRRKNKLSAPSIFMVWLTLSISLLFTPSLTTAKRFDKDKPIDLLSQIDNLGVPIEVTQELIEFEPIHKGQAKPKPPASKPNSQPSKPKPEFGLSMFQFPKPELNYSSSWSLGSAFPSLGSSFSAHRPQSTPSNSPYLALEKPESTMASETSILVSPSGMNTGMSHSGTHGRPPRPPPSQGISADTHFETEALVPKPPSGSGPGIQSRPPSQSQQQSPSTILYLDPSNIPPPIYSQAPSSPSSWNTQPVAYPQSQSHPPQPVASSSQGQASPPTWLSQPQQNTWTLQPSPPVSSQPSPVYSQQSPPAYQQSPPVYQQSPPTYSQPPPPVYSQSSPAYQQSPPTYSQPPPPIYSQSPPAYSQQAYQPQNPSAPFSMYQQLNLHLLEHDTWEKVQHPNEHPEQYQPPPLQLFQQQLIIPPPPSNLFTPDISAINSVPSISNTLDGILDDSVNEVGGNVDYPPNPGFSPVPHYTSNSDINISIEDEKFFYTDDDFAEYPDRRKHQDKDKEENNDKDKNQEENNDKDKNQDDYNEQSEGEIVEKGNEKGEGEEPEVEKEKEEGMKTPPQIDDSDSILQGKSDKEQDDEDSDKDKDDMDEIMEMVE